jgi:hypothetical protein
MRWAVPKTIKVGNFVYSEVYLFSVREFFEKMRGINQNCNAISKKLFDFNRVLLIIYGLNPLVLGKRSIGNPKFD